MTALLISQYPSRKISLMNDTTGTPSIKRKLLGSIRCGFSNYFHES